MQPQLNISKNLLPKIPQFWETPGAAFAELVQNAWRAGANEIHLQIDTDIGTVTIQDNGRGIQTLDDFLTIGQSNWAREVTEPAGMGFYAHFGYCQQTVVESRGLRYTFTPACLAGAPVGVEPCEGTGRTIITVSGATHINEIAWARMRPLPPPEREITFTVNGQAIPNPLATMTPLETPIGVVYLRRLDSPTGLPTGLWEDLLVGYTYSIHQTLVVLEKDYIWAVDPACGVRPRLPGREGFIQNTAYAEALAVVSQAIETYCQSRARNLPLETLPEVLDWSQKELVESLAAAGIQEVVVKKWVQTHRYCPVRIFEGQWDTEDGYPEYPLVEHVSIRQDRVRRFRLEEAYQDESEVVEILLNNQAGHWKGRSQGQGEIPETIAFTYDQAKGLPLTLTALREHVQGRVADAIQLSTRLVLDAHGLCFQDGEPVWIGVPEQILEHAENLVDLWAFCEHHREYGELGELIGSSNEFEVSLLQRQLADRYGLNEDINLRNWLRRTRQNMRWEIPKPYLAFFERALAQAERQAIRHGYTLAEINLTNGGVP